MVPPVTLKQWSILWPWQIVSRIYDVVAAPVNGSKKVICDHDLETEKKTRTKAVRRKNFIMWIPVLAYFSKR